jgi:hypothetical protein
MCFIGDGVEAFGVGGKVFGGVFFLDEILFMLSDVEESLAVDARVCGFFPSEDVPYDEPSSECMAVAEGKS